MRRVDDLIGGLRFCADVADDAILDQDIGIMQNAVFGVDGDDGLRVSNQRFHSGAVSFLFQCCKMGGAERAGWLRLTPLQ